jgi:hypothetical protein
MLIPERLYMKIINGSIAGLVLAGVLALAPATAFSHGGGGFGGGGGHGGGGFGGGGGHGGGYGGGFGGGHGGSFGGGHGGSFGGGGHFGAGGMRAGAPAGFVGGHASGGRGSAFAGRGFHERFHRHDFRHDHDRFFTGDYPYYDPYYGYDYDAPYYGYDDPYDGYYNDKAGEYSETIIAVQKELAKRGYYHGPIDGVIGPETRKAISWFQSIDKLSVTGQIDDPTLRALRIS